MKLIVLEADAVDDRALMGLLVGRSLADMERALIAATLDRCGGNRTHAARVLGITVRTLRNKLNRYADRMEPRGAAAEAP